jgi:glucose-1-phosphatase
VTERESPISLLGLDAVVFDLGGVILHLNYQATIQRLSAIFEQDVAQLYTQAKQSDVFDEYERGELSTPEFQRRLIELLPERRDEILERLIHAEYSSQIDDAWNAILLHIPEENLAFLRDLKRKVGVYLLSNTNDSHLQRFLANYERDHARTHGPFAQHFHATYYSHQLGQRKPEPRIYQTVLERNHLNPARTLFIDDNRTNLAGAQSVGLQTVYHPTNSPLVSRWKLEEIPLSSHEVS